MSEHVFISGGNPHPTSRFGRVELGPTTHSYEYLNKSLRVGWFPELFFHGDLVLLI